MFKKTREQEKEREKKKKKTLVEVTGDSPPVRLVSSVSLSDPDRRCTVFRSVETLFDSKAAAARDHIDKKKIQKKKQRADGARGKQERRTDGRTLCFYVHSLNCHA